MLNFWAGRDAGSTGSLSPTSIKEANEQVQYMHARILDLEQRIREQTELLARRDQQHTANFRRLEHEKNLALSALQFDLRRSEERCSNLEKIIKEKDMNMAFLLHRCSYLDEAASYAPVLEQLTLCLTNAFSAQPPKVNTVKPTTRMTAIDGNGGATGRQISQQLGECCPLVNECHEVAVKKHTKNS
uniref:Uncharacterized protein n=1 Tax=Romanomermis culicivorax TaxID=13658 RepID=A0A915JSU2_ROMCU